MILFCKGQKLETSSLPKSFASRMGECTGTRIYCDHSGISKNIPLDKYAIVFSSGSSGDSEIRPIVLITEKLDPR